MSSGRITTLNHLKNATKYSTEINPTSTSSALKSIPSFNEKDKLYSHLEVELKGVDPAVLKSYSWFATTAANHLGIPVGEW